MGEKKTNAQRKADAKARAEEVRRKRAERNGGTDPTAALLRMLAPQNREQRRGMAKNLRAAGRNGRRGGNR